MAENGKTVSSALNHKLQKILPFRLPKNPASTKIETQAESISSAPLDTSAASSHWETWAAMGSHGLWKPLKDTPFAKSLHDPISIGWYLVKFEENMEKVWLPSEKSKYCTFSTLLYHTNPGGSRFSWNSRCEVPRFHPRRLWRAPVDPPQKLITQSDVTCGELSSTAKSLESSEIFDFGQKSGTKSVPGPTTQPWREPLQSFASPPRRPP